MQFKDLSLSDPLLKRISELDFEEPTAIQKIAIPEILNGQNAIIRAETGSGKTAAFAIPLLSGIQIPKNEIEALILVPTRELAVQVQKEIKNLAFYIPNLKISAFYGGHAFDAERKSLMHPPHILVATPGRLADHLRRDTVKLENVTYFVIDEADKLLEMGFEEELKFILKYLPFKRQTIMLSATFPPALDKLATIIFREIPARLEADSKTVPLQIENIIIKSAEAEKDNVLKVILEKSLETNAIIFCNTRDKCRAISQLLENYNIKNGLLHGELEQADRDKVMAKFRNGSIKVLVATDLASRGIDIIKLGVVINYELPDQSSAFLHRVGRTGRAGEQGLVYSIVTDREWHKLQNWTDIPDYRIIALKNILETSSKSKLENPPKKVQSKSTLHFQAGRKEKMSKGDIVGALIAEAGLESSEIGIIEIFDHFSYAAVPSSKAKQTVEKLTNGKIKGKKIKVSLLN